MDYSFSKQVIVNTSKEELFNWHKRAASFDRLTPWWVHLKNIKRSDGIVDGARVSFTQKIRPFSFNWQLEHFGYKEASQFCDRALLGPFKQYEHHHLFSEKAPTCTLLQDHIFYDTYSLLHAFVEKKLQKLFSFRHAITKYDLEHVARYEKKQKRILIAGASGFIGTHLSIFLQASGHTVDALQRKKPGLLYWDPERASISQDALEGYDVIINLSGHPLFKSLWTKKQKDAICRSRIGATRLLVQTIRQLKMPPQVFLSASAIGYYGSYASEMLTEDTGSGSGFLAGVCREWEEASSLEGIRNVQVRFGLVLSPQGGALSLMLPAFRCGLAGPLGDGKQYMSWISIDDAVRAIHHCIADSSMSGPVNITAKNPITNQEFTQTLASLLKRPAFLRVPKRVLHGVLQELADETVLSSVRVFPQKLVNSNFVFQHELLQDALLLYL